MTRKQALAIVGAVLLLQIVAAAWIVTNTDFVARQENSRHWY